MKYHDMCAMWYSQVISPIWKIDKICLWSHNRILVFSLYYLLHIMITFQKKRGRYYSATQNGRSMCVIAFFLHLFFCLISFLTPSSLWGSKAIALFRLCWCKGLQKALIKRWKGIKSRYNLLSLIRLRSIENFCYLLHNLGFLLTQQK